MLKVIYKHKVELTKDFDSLVDLDAWASKRKYSKGYVTLIRAGSEVSEVKNFHDLATYVTRELVNAFKPLREL